MSKKKELANTISNKPLIISKSKGSVFKDMGITDSEMIDYILDIVIEHNKRINKLERKGK